MASSTAVAYTRYPRQRPSQAKGLTVIRSESGETGLARALRHIFRGEADTLFLERLHDASGSLRELVRLLDWLSASGAELVAADVGLDTSTPAGRRTVALLREIDRWGREPEHPRRPLGRPGLSAGSPQLAERLASMRERGLSLRQIAAALNQEGVPTPRGGARWRASSVQSALGYRRPRPPAPGAPPPRPPRPPATPPPGHGPPPPHRP